MRQPFPSSVPRQCSPLRSTGRRSEGRDGPCCQGSCCARCLHLPPGQQPRNILCLRGLGGAELGSSQPHSESSTAPAEMAGTGPGGAEPAQLGGTGHKMFQQGKEQGETRINLWWMLCHCQLQNGRSSAPPSTSLLAPTPPRAAGLPGCSSCWVPWSGVERHREALGVKRSLAPLGCWSISCRRALAAPLFSSTERGAHVQVAAAALRPHGKPGVTPSHVCSQDLWRCAGGCRRGVKPPPSPSLQHFCSGGGSSTRGEAVQRWASCCWVTRRAAAPLPATSAPLLPGRWVLRPAAAFPPAASAPSPPALFSWSLFGAAPRCL